MFEDDLGPDPVPPPPPPPEPWECCDDDSWIDELAAGDPERPLSAAQVLRAAEAGRFDASVSAALAEIDPGSLDDDAKLALVVAAARCEAHHAGVKARAVAAFAGPAPRDDRSAAAFAWAEISAALCIGERSARSYVEDVRHLAGRLPATLAAVLEGLPWSKARRVIDATQTLTREQCAAVEARVLPGARDRTAKAHADGVARAVRAVDPDGWRARRRTKLADVALIRFHHGDGVADVIAQRLDSADADTIWIAADTWARQQKAGGDERSLDALRVAALVAFAKAYLTGSGVASGGVPTRNAEPAVVNIVIGLPDAVTGCGTAMLAGSGEPLPAEAVAGLLRAGARIRFALVDGSGRLVGISTKLHDPPALMRAYVALRDLTARTPSGSSAAVAGQDLDHIDPRGPTTPGNLHAPTRGWHRARTFGHWSLRAGADGTVTWTSRRTGRSYVTRPYNFRDGP